MQIAGYERESIVDGPGFRFAIFFQGCPHKCEGCHNPETWNAKGGVDVDIDDIVSEVEKAYYIDGVTISGGEPFFQVDSLIELASKLKEKKYNIICFTGYTFEQIMADEKMRQALSFIDTLIDGKFVLEQRSIALRFRGSKNQRVIDVQKSLQENEIVLLDW